MKRFNTFLIFILLVGSTSCIDDVLCSDTFTNQLRIKFVKLSSAEDSIISVQSITAVNANDSFPMINDTTGAFWQLPMNPDAVSTNFVFTFSDTLVRNLEVKYDLVKRIIEVDCPPELAFTLIDSTNSTFDTLRIIEPEVSINNDNNIEIYL